MRTPPRPTAHGARRHRAPGRTRGAGVALVAIWVALVALVLAAGPASAHATLVSSSPAPDEVLEVAPREVTLHFDEPVDLDLGGGLRVFAPDGRRVEHPSSVRNGGVDVAAGIDSTQLGSYTVAWRVVSEDSHVLAGSFVFHVQRETGAVAITVDDRTDLDVLAWFARWWIVTAMVIVGGLGAFGWFVSRDGSLDPVARRLIVSLASLGVVGSALRFATQVATASGRSLADGSSLWVDAVRTTRAGRIDVARIGACAVMLLATCAWSRRAALSWAMSGAAGVAFANAYGGHAWTVPDNSIALLASVIHQGAVAVWVGGLVGLALLLRGAPGAAAAARFSTMAGWALAVTALSAAGWYQAGLLDGLVSSGYGRVVLAKIAIAVAMAAVGWRNRTALASFVARRRSFVRGVQGEVALAALALGITAALVGMVPARAAGPQVFTATRDDAAGSVSVTVTPARAGANTMHISFFDANGRPRTVDVAEATVAIDDVPARRIDLSPVAQGHFSASGFSLPTAGDWTVTIRSVTRGAVATTSFEVRVR